MHLELGVCSRLARQATSSKDLCVSATLSIRVTNVPCCTHFLKYVLEIWTQASMIVHQEPYSQSHLPGFNS